jgi:N-acetylmuramoyl-L-alanine amidase
MERIAIIVGHTEAMPGAKLYNGQYEYEFNTIAVCLVQKKFLLGQVQTFWKDFGNYIHEVKKFRPDLIIELHINAFIELAYGCEGFVLQSSLKSKYEAQILLEKFETSFKIKSRGIKTLTRGGERGFFNLKVFEEIPMVLFEPCFGNFKTRDSKKIIEDVEGYANFLIDYLNLRLGIEEKTRQNAMDKMISIMKSWFK